MRVPHPSASVVRDFMTTWDALRGRSVVLSPEHRGAPAPSTRGLVSRAQSAWEAGSRVPQPQEGTAASALSVEGCVRYDFAAMAGPTLASWLHVILPPSVCRNLLLVPKQQLRRHLPSASLPPAGV